MALQFTRDVKVYIINTNSSNQAWEVKVLDDFTFSQSMNSTEVALNEAGSTSRRARLLFNDSLAPAEWSFSTYVRPYDDGGSAAAPEEALWAMLLGASASSGHQFSATGNVNTPSATTNTFNLSQSNVGALADGWTIVVEVNTGTAQYYVMENAVVNSATIDFDVEGIATIQWSGFAGTIESTTSAPTGVAGALWGGGNVADCDIIRNRISTISLTDNSISGPTYNVVLTGGSFTIENNITYLTPEELGVINAPCANVTGTRSISGNITCYLNTGATNSGGLFANLLADTTTIRNSFDLSINIGGETSGPRLYLDMPTAHLEIPAIGVEDLLTLDIAFHALPGNGDLDQTNEATIAYNI